MASGKAVPGDEAGRDREGARGPQGMPAPDGMPGEDRERASGEDRERGNRREEIVQAAFELFSERGYRGASLGQVAKRVGLTNAGLLHYFSSKEELLTVVLAERDRANVALVRQAHPAATTLHGRLEQLRTLVAHNAQNMGLVQAFTVLAAESVTENHPAQNFFRRRYGIIRTALADTLEAHSGERLTGAEADAVASLLVAVMDGLQVQWLLDPDAVDMEAAFAVFERMLEQLVEE